MEIRIVITRRAIGLPDSGASHSFEDLTLSVDSHMKKRREADSERVSMCCWSRRAGFYGCREGKLLVVLGFQDFAAAIKAIRADVMTQMRFTRD